MWRKFLIVCLFGTVFWKPAEAGIAAHDAGQSMERAQSPSQVAPANRRIALVIGNAGYAQAALTNPVNDADAMTRTLSRLGFEVMSYRDLGGQQMKQAISEFSRRLDRGGIGLFYFAGHGFQVADQTLLLPVDTDSRYPSRLLTQAISLQTVLQGMSAARPDKLNLVILDTCLDNPFRSGAASMQSAPARTLIAYATEAGAPAADGLYTAELLKAMAVPGLDFQAMLRQAAAGVRQASKQRQRPWSSSSLQGGFRLNPMRSSMPALSAVATTQAAPALQSRGVLPKDSAEQYELTFWDSIKDSNHIEDYEAYLKAYPNGRFAPLARARIERLRAAAAKEAPAAKPAPEAARPPVTKPAPEPARPPTAKAPAPEPARPPAARAPEPVRPPPAAKTPAEPKPPSARAPAKPPELASPAPVPAPIPEKRPPVRLTEIKDCPACPVLISLPAGAFTMGSSTGDPSEKPPHHVTVTKPFAIGKYEVTVEQWDACVDTGGCPRVGNGDGRPKNTAVRDVSWDDAQQYVAWLTKISGKSYRLPTEAEWEYAARGGTTTRYWWGEQMRAGIADCKDCGGPWNKDGPTPVGSFPPNPYGLFDMNGSVWEWVSDCWHNSFKGAPADSRAWEDPNCRVRVIRGGSWREGASYMPSTTRFKYDSNVRHSQNGFRVVRDLQ